MMNLIEIQQEMLAQRKMKNLDYFNILQLKNNQLETTKKVVLLLICNLKLPVNYEIDKSNSIGSSFFFLRIRLSV